MVEKNGQEIGLSDEFKPRLQNLLALTLVNLHNLSEFNLFICKIRVVMVTHFFVQSIPFTHLVKKYFLCIYSVPDTLLALRMHQLKRERDLSNHSLPLQYLYSKGGYKQKINTK